MSIENEPDAIRQEMDETRSSLTDKISLLEQHVVETVHEASVGVQQTVEAVKETVQSVRDSVGETVESVKESFSLSGHVERHPWFVMAGSAGLGLFAGYVFMGGSSKAPAADARGPRRTGNGSHKDPSAIPTSFANVLAPAAAPEEPSESVLHQLTRTFENEINQLKGLAIGTLAGVVRDLLGPHLPQTMRSPVEEVFNNLTTKLGGQPVRGRIVPEEWTAKRTTDDDHRAPYSESVRNQRQTTL